MIAQQNPIFHQSSKTFEEKDILPFKSSAFYDEVVKSSTPKYILCKSCHQLEKIGKLSLSSLKSVKVNQTIKSNRTKEQTSSSSSSKSPNSQNPECSKNSTKPTKENLPCSTSRCPDFEMSSDSGFSGNEIPLSSQNKSANSKNTNENLPYFRSYAIEISVDLIGRLIGKQGSVIRQIKKETNTQIFIIKHPTRINFELVIVEGMNNEVLAAIKTLQKLFPKKYYPKVDFSDVALSEAMETDVVVSAVISAGHFFIQQPYHPSFYHLSVLDNCMTLSYNEVDDAPLLPKPIPQGVICVCVLNNNWYRVQITKNIDDEEKCLVKYLDHGGFQIVTHDCLRQIRSDFMQLPFQATECYLPNIKPLEGEKVFSVEACKFYEQYVEGKSLKAKIVGFASDFIPFVSLFLPYYNEANEVELESLSDALCESNLVQRMDELVL